MEQFYRNIKFLCKFNHIRMNELEKQLDISIGYLSKTAKHRKNLSIEKIAKISEILGVTVDDLINRDYAKELKLPLARTDFIESYTNLRELIPREEIIGIINKIDKD